MPRGGSSIVLPVELRAVKGKVLEDYVRHRILDFVGEQGFAKRLYASPVMARAAAQETLAELSRPEDAENDRLGGEFKLVFRHTCLSLGCLDGECLMCQNTPHRRCVSNFAPKYLSGDAVKAKCGAAIAVEVLDQATGRPVGQEAVEGLHLEVCILEGKSYGEAEPEAVTEAFLDANTLLVNAQGKELLAPGKGSEHTEDKRVIASFVNGKAELSVNILGSSIAMLTGQKPPFRLLVRAISSDTGARVPHVRHAVSDAFVVATQRVKGAQKAEIPHIEEHVSKIENVGVQTQNKLQDIRAAAAAAGISGINVVHNTVSTVGQFKELVESTAKDMPLQEALRKVLNFTSKGWEAAKAHAFKAVETDNRMRIWLADDSHSRGLLFRCNLGRVDLDAPVGYLSGNGSGGGSPTQVEMEAMLAQHPAYDRQGAAWLQRRAFECWWLPGHPGWSVWPADSEQFIRGVVEAGDAILGRVQIIAQLPATPHSRYKQEASPSEPADDFSAPSQQRSSPAQSVQKDSNQRSRQPADASISTDGQSHTLDGRSASLAGIRGSQAVGASGPDAAGNGLLLSAARGAATSNASTASAPSRGMPSGSWNFNIPLVNGQPMRRTNPELPASPFDVPTTNSPPAAAPDGLSGSESFSFRPGPSRPGTGALTQALQSALPNQLPTLSTQEMEQIMELQRRMSNEAAANDASMQLPLSFLSNLAGEPQLQNQQSFPSLLTRLSGLLATSGAQGEEGANANGAALLAPLARFQQAIRQEQNEQRGAAGSTTEAEGMPLRFSGKVSGILDDLSDAMSMLHDLLPSAASDANLQAGRGDASTSAAPGSEANLAGFALPNMTSYNAPSKTPQLSMIASAEGSNGLANGAPPLPGAKRRRMDSSQ